MNAPKSLADLVIRQSRLAAIHEPHVASLTEYVHRLRARLGGEYSIPYFDPADAGIGAECLFLLEAPGSRAVKSGFVSRDNPDETAKNFFELTQEAGIPRQRSAMWNIVPWYIGSGRRIRAARASDLRVSVRELPDLLAFFPKLRVVVLVGSKPGTAKAAVAARLPQVPVIVSPHPSPLFINRAPGNRGRLLLALKEAATVMLAARSSG